MQELTEAEKQIILQQKQNFKDVLGNNHMQVIFKAATAYLINKANSNQVIHD